MKRVVLSKVESIERCIKRIDEIYGGDIKRLNDYLYQDAIVLNIQRACQQSIDLSMYLCSKLAFGIPKSSRDSFVLLKENGIITEKTSNLMEKMVGFRNIVIHEYQSVELDVIKFIVEKGIGDFSSYTKEVLSYMKKVEE
ncbi:type VII toxin-antitoxin system HepT family RNase toxin [Psychrilyobacter atlanticus]|uniref:type VII toxin-antitoxin system HepT family RNase toxin n=1 Tax=Psychrilyobacter atlanticus TaxID=271091 RepID=UPI00040363E8|nr:DUF86 domain-containing protein [Psychrilyobacter atlanticus]